MTKKKSAEEVRSSLQRDELMLTVDEFKTKLVCDVKEYTGEMVDGVRHGYGTGRWPDGKKYAGQWRNGDRQGQGVVTWPSGQKYIGEWQEDIATGKGILSKPDGYVYAGEFLDSQRHGIGSQTYSNGATYAGGWKDNHPEGWGVIRTAEGKQVIGRLEINRRHGRGVQFFENGKDDDTTRIYWEEGEFMEQSEWFTREQGKGFIEESRRMGIPFSEGSKISNQEKIYVLNGISENSLNDLREVSGLSMMAMVYAFKTGVMHVPAAPKLTTRADCALTSVCRVVAVVNRRSAQSAQLIKLQSAATPLAIPNWATVRSDRKVKSEKSYSGQVEDWWLSLITINLGGLSWTPHAFFNRAAAKPFGCPKNTALPVPRWWYSTLATAFFCCPQTTPGKHCKPGWLRLSLALY